MNFFARYIWPLIFLGIFTLGAIVEECVAGFWGPGGIKPWTYYIAHYVPWPIQLLAYVILAVWLPFHFYKHDKIRAIAYNKGQADAHSNAYKIMENAILLSKASGTTVEEARSNLLAVMQAYQGETNRKWMP